MILIETDRCPYFSSVLKLLGMLLLGGGIFGALDALELSLVKAAEILLSLLIVEFNLLDLGGLASLDWSRHACFDACVEFSLEGSEGWWDIELVTEGKFFARTSISFN